MEFGEIVFYIFIALIFIHLSIKFLFTKTEQEKEYERKMKESLADEFIYDPETGAKLTLEEAESGNWITHDNPNRIKSEEELDKYYSGREKEAEELTNFIKSNGYEFTKLTDSQIGFLEKSKILSKYDYWEYSNSFTFSSEKHFIFFPGVSYYNEHHQPGYNESQIMFWINDPNLSGHVYLRDKTSFEAIADAIRNDDEIKLNNFETFIYKKSNNMIALIKTLQLFDDEKELEIEVIEGNLLFKSMKFVNRTDFLRMEKIAKLII
ncbi:hypothetical protein AR687_10425 [Flavobacteriaceae bacterium CRH]|nr:hypothetical protein AR687_10425 [Flavobacteriaceae bacterium CRH]